MTGIRTYVFTPAEEADVAASIARLLAIAPPLSEEKKDRLWLLLHPGVRRQHRQS